jgi:Family of unknown function (DUF6152)
MMKRKTNYLPVLSLLLSTLSMPALAHHGTAVFDMENLTTVKGTVTKFEFMNPHALIYVDVAGNKGNVEHWIMEESSNNHLSRIGWEKNALKPGDAITVTGHRARNGARVLELQCTECFVVDPQGKVLGYEK